MHTTAHPDDEHGGLLAMLSRGDGARVSLLTLNRGEAGDNAIGPELFDALGLIRTEELLRADQYYGVDAQYFTTVIDYGFSKRLEEALVKWGRENVLRDVVRVIRTERPLVVIARFQGNERDGHGNHQTAGLITQEAYKVAGDPNVFPEQIREGLRPWQPLKLYMGGDARERGLDAARRSRPSTARGWATRTRTSRAPASASSVRRTAAATIRSRARRTATTSGWRRRSPSGAKETSVFDGIDTQHHRPVHDAEASGARERLDAARRDPAGSRRRGAGVQDGRSVGHRAGAGARAGGHARAPCSNSLPTRMPCRSCSVKEQQFADAINTALGIDFAAVAQPAGLPEPTGPVAAFAAPPTMAPVVPGQAFDVKLRFTNRGSVDVTVARVDVGAGSGDDGLRRPTLKRDRTLTLLAKMTVPSDAAFTASIFLAPVHCREPLHGQRHRVAPSPGVGAGASSPPSRYNVGGVPVDISVPVTRREAQLPYGYVMRELAVVPALAVTVSPRQAIVPPGDRRTRASACRSS